MQMLTSCHRRHGAWSPPLTASQDSPTTLVLAFGASGYADDPGVFAELRAAFPQSVLAGCSTSGEVLGMQVQDDSIAVAVVRFEHTQIRQVHTPVTGPEDSGAAGTRLAAQLPPAGLRAVFVLSDGLRVNGTALAAALTAGLPPAVSVTGGLAGDGSAFQRTWVLVDDRPQTHRVCAIGLYGERLHVGSGCQGGWLDFGPLRRITRSAGTVLHELDGKPALDLYREYLGELATGLPGAALLFPLSIREPGRPGAALVRSVLAIDEAARSLTFAGDMPEGFQAQLMRTSNDRLIDSASLAIAQAVHGLPAACGPALVVSVSCVGRRLVLGERTEEEAESLAEGAPAQSVHVGFYSYGEIAPGAEGGACSLHNQTMTVTVFAEA